MHFKKYILLRYNHKTTSAIVQKQWKGDWFVAGCTVFFLDFAVATLIVHPYVHSIHSLSNGTQQETSHGLRTSRFAL